MIGALIEHLPKQRLFRNNNDYDDNNNDNNGNNNILSAANVIHSVSCQNRKFNTELELAPIELIETQPTKRAKIIKQEAKRKGLDAIKSKWEQNPLHFQYVLRSKDADIDRANTHQWLRCSGLKAETEGFIMAAQDQSLHTRNYQANVIKNGTDPRCRLCEDKVETIDHLVAGWPILAPKEYKERHDKTGQYLHWRICQHYNAPYAEHWYEHQPEPVTKGNGVTILGTSQYIQTDQLMPIGQTLLRKTARKRHVYWLIDRSATFIKYTELHLPLP